ncbi:dienelactone hydrolase family protein [Kitasatospora sp. NPDC004531]
MPTQIRTELLHIPTRDGLADALAAFPTEAGTAAQAGATTAADRLPGVLMYPDAFGIRPALTELAAELAGHGYYVLVPNLFYRHGPTPVVDLPTHIDEQARPELLARLMPLITAHTRDQALLDADAYLRFLTARPEVSPGPVGVTGYCIGGLHALRTAAAHPHQVAALAAFHAPVHADGPAPFAALTAEVHFGHAASDLTPETLAELNHSLTAAGVTHTSEIYPGTVHGFTMPDTDAFAPSALRLHWDRLLPLLARTIAP